jgi:Domain of unknown function (DUF4190)
MTNPQQPENPAEPQWQQPIPPQPPSYDQPRYDPPAYDPNAFTQPGYGQQPPAPGQPAYGQPAYGQPAYGQPVYGQPVYVNPNPTNGLALASLICSLAGLITFISAPVGAILGHVSRKQIKERGGQGEGMALAGIIVGWVLTGLFVCSCLGLVVIPLIFAATAAGTSTGY